MSEIIKELEEYIIELNNAIEDYTECGELEIANTLEEVYQRLKSFFLDSERQPTTEAKQEP